MLLIVAPRCRLLKLLGVSFKVGKSNTDCISGYVITS
jgi:hypothetical protein